MTNSAGLITQHQVIQILSSSNEIFFSSPSNYEEIFVADTTLAQWLHKPPPSPQAVSLYKNAHKTIVKPVRNNENERELFSVVWWLFSWLCTSLYSLPSSHQAESTAQQQLLNSSLFQPCLAFLGTELKTVLCTLYSELCTLYVNCSAEAWRLSRPSLKICHHTRREVRLCKLHNRRTVNIWCDWNLKHQGN